MQTLTHPIAATPTPTPIPGRGGNVRPRPRGLEWLVIALLVGGELAAVGATRTDVLPADAVTEGSDQPSELAAEPPPEGAPDETP